jgi:hypothetical protein
MEAQYRDLVVGNPELPETFVNAVINKGAYTRCGCRFVSRSERAS